MNLLKLVHAVAASAVEAYGGPLIKRLAKRTVKGFTGTSVGPFRLPTLRATISKPVLGLGLAVGFVSGALRRVPDNPHPREGTLVVQQHDAERAGTHFDVSIIDDDGRELFRGVRSGEELADMFPTHGSRRQWIQTTEHKSSYSLEFEGRISEGYGAGFVQRRVCEPCEIMKSSPGRIDFRLYAGQFSGGYVMLSRGDSSWLVVKRNAEDRTTIPKMEFKSAKDVPSLLIEEGNFLYEHKVDGSQADITFGREANKLSSWRTSAKTEASINYDDKLPGWRDETHQEFAGVQAKVEIVFAEQGVQRGAPFISLGLSPFVSPRLQRPKLVEYAPIGIERPSWLAGGLNSNEWKARQRFRDAHGETVAVILDIRRWKGGLDVGKLSYGEKRVMAEELARTYSFIYVPRSWDDGQEAWNAVVTDEGREGLVRKRLSSPTPYPGSGVEKLIKAKQRDFLDVRVTGMVTLVRKSGEEDPTMMGALTVQDEDGRSFEVGTGFTNDQRSWFMKNHAAVVSGESWIRIRHDPKQEDRSAPHASVFHSIHENKSEGVITELGMLEYADYDYNSMYAMKTSAGWERR